FLQILRVHDHVNPLDFPGFNRDLEPKHRMPFATIVTKDYGDFDRASNLNRPGVFRLNIGVSKETYRSLFGPQPPPPGASGVVDTGHDFTAVDQIMPHTRSMRGSHRSACLTPARPRSRRCDRYSPRRMSWPSEGMPKYGRWASPNPALHLPGAAIPDFQDSK